MSATVKVNHPMHYGGGEDPYEVIKVLRAKMTPDEFRGFCLGNVLKYTMRAGKKEGESEARDLAKAAWYLDHYRTKL